MTLVEVTRVIQCKGCGQVGKAVWDAASCRNGFRLPRTPLSVIGPFYLHGREDEAAGRAIACNKCQQIYTPE